MTLRVQGFASGGGDAVLTIADGATNAGVILLESLDGVAHAYLVLPAGRFTDLPTGVINVQLPPGWNGPGSIAAGWLEDDGDLSDTTGLPVLPSLQAAVLEYNTLLSSGVPTDPGDGSSVNPLNVVGGTLQTLAQMGQTAGVSDGLIAVGGVGGSQAPSVGGSSSNSSGGATGSSSSTVNGLFTLEGQLWLGWSTLVGLGANLVGSAVSYGLQGVAQAGYTVWDAANGYVALAAYASNQVFGTPLYQPQPLSVWMQSLTGQGGANALTTQVNVFAAAAGGRVTGVVNGVLVQLPLLVRDALVVTAAGLQGVGLAADLNVPVYSEYAQGLAAARLQGTQTAYVAGAVANTVTFGLYGLGSSLGPALATVQRTGDPTALTQWAGGAAIDLWLLRGLVRRRGRPRRPAVARRRRKDRRRRAAVGGPR